MSIAAVVATIATGLFAGAAAYITLVEHPARLACGPALAIRQFRPSYHRGAVMQASLAAIGCAAALARWWVSGSLAWLAGGALIGALIPFTLIVVFPTNTRLLDERLDSASSDAAMLLRRWGRLHAVRTVLGVAAFVLFVVRLSLS